MKLQRLFGRFTSSVNLRKTKGIGAFASVLAIGLAVLASPVSAIAGHGRYFPDAPAGFIGGWGGINNGGPRQFNATVTDFGKNINAGEVRFDLDTYTLAGGAGGGSALSGGFFANNGVRVKDGFTLAWVQTVTATYTGQNSWNLPAMNAGEFPDATPRDRANGTLLSTTDLGFAPTYPFNSPATVNVPFAPPTLGFQDFPGRSFANGNQSWLAELALVAIANDAVDGKREVRVAGSLLWGFDFVGLPVAGGGAPGIANITGFGPLLWSEATTSFIDKLNQFYDGLGGGGGPANMGNAVVSDRYNFSKNSNIFIPTPGSLALLAMAGVLAHTRRRRGDSPSIAA